jgi:hypothetical protein
MTSLLNGKEYPYVSLVIGAPSLDRSAPRPAIHGFYRSAFDVIQQAARHEVPLDDRLRKVASGW